MKYGKRLLCYTESVRNIVGNYNYGNNYQIHGLEKIYESMNLSESEIKDIITYTVKDYEGEPVRLPFVGNFSGAKKFHNAWPPAAGIDPVFYGFNMTDIDFPEMISYLKKHEPIGCRDEETKLLLEKEGVSAFLSGCLSVTLPTRETTPEHGKIFLIDTPKELEAHIPEELRSRCEYISQNYPVDVETMTIEDEKRVHKNALAQLERYKKEAACVVSSKLHAIAPCLGLGIPVIFTLNNIDGRFAWLEKLIPFYDKTNYHEIDWYPEPVVFEEIKEKMVKALVTKLKTGKFDPEEIQEVSHYWENRPKFQYNRVLHHDIKCMLSDKKKEDSFRYAIWGAGTHGQIAKSFMEEHFPNAKLTTVVDKYFQYPVWGCTPIVREELNPDTYDYMILTSIQARFEEKETMDSLGAVQNREYCFFVSMDYSDIF